MGILCNYKDDYDTETNQWVLTPKQLNLVIHPSQEGWTELKYYLVHPTSMGHKQTPGYHKTRVLNKVQLFDRFKSKESELDRFEKLGSCTAFPRIQLSPSDPSSGCFVLRVTGRDEISCTGNWKLGLVSAFALEWRVKPLKSGKKNTGTNSPQTSYWPPDGLLWSNPSVGY